MNRKTGSEQIQRLIKFKNIIFLLIRPLPFKSFHLIVLTSFSRPNVPPANPKDNSTVTEINEIS
jgi:hypothetical protein